MTENESDKTAALRGWLEVLAEKSGSDLFLVEQRGFAGTVAERDLPVGAGDRLELGGEVARPVRAQRSHRLERQLRRSEADQPDLVVELLGELMLALFLEQPDQRLEVRREAW